MCCIGCLFVLYVMVVSPQKLFFFLLERRPDNNNDNQSVKCRKQSKRVQAGRLCVH